MIKFRTFITSCISMLVAFCFVQNIHSGQNVEVIEKNIDKFPYKIQGYKGNDIRMEDEIIKELKTDVYMFRKYFDKNNKEITLYIGYYGTKKGGRTGHNPSSCYPGSGWSILDKEEVSFRVAYDGTSKIITVNSLQVKKADNIASLVYHWYQSNRNVVLSTGIKQNIHRFKSKILYNRNDGAFVRVSTPIQGDLKETEKRIQDFIRVIFPLIVEHWPVEKEV